MPGIAGRKALVKVTGAPVVFAGEATTDSGDHQTYQITNAAKRVWDRNTLLVVKVAGVPTVESYTFNRLTGKVTFATVNAGRAAVTLDGAYLPLSVAIGSKNYSYSLMKQALVDTDFDGANSNGGFNTYQTGLFDVEGSIGRRITADTSMRDALLAGDPVVIQLFADRAAAADLTVWALLDKNALVAALDGMQEGTIEFKGTADDQGVAVA
jgi:hypothetical protein